jgi:hypothetical protein
VTDFYNELYQQAGDIKPINISIDTLSHAFAGNEIDRVQVYAFAMHMRRLAKVANGSVTVLSHPSLQGIASGSGISGSTAWHNAFRFRMYLRGVKDAALDDLFIEMLGKFQRQGRNVSHNKNAPNYAPKQFAADPKAAKPGTQKALAEAMERLFAAGKIVVENYGKPSNPHHRIAEVGQK